MSRPPIPASGRRFELSGDALCLDFANSWGDRGRPESDRLTTPGDLLAFARQAGSTPRPVLARLAGELAGERADAWLHSARELREAIYALLAARAAGRRAPAGALDRLDAVLRETLPARGLRPARGAVTWAWREDVGPGAALLGPIALSAAELLVSDDAARVRECDSPSCTWLFLDRSRGGTRRWCSMAGCGNRAKARRHYRRRAGRPSDGGA